MVSLISLDKFKVTVGWPYIPFVTGHYWFLSCLKWYVCSVHFRIAGVLIWCFQGVCFVRKANRALTFLIHSHRNHTMSLFNNLFMEAEKNLPFFFWGKCTWTSPSDDKCSKIFEGILKKLFRIHWEGKILSETWKIIDWPATILFLPGTILKVETREQTHKLQILKAWKWQKGGHCSFIVVGRKKSGINWSRWGTQFCRLWKDRSFLLNAGQINKAF